ncbi:MAG TPA: RHS repeat-associated core domain-containing protein [Actinoplanes sp.]|nr:RHS repeat-associated core domain-containing protein [Actinoplanes sp.]
MGERGLDPTHPLVRQGQDYRVLQPALVMDPNRNRAAVAFDALGMVVGTAVMGKPEEDPVPGDRLTAAFRADLTQAEIDEFFTNPKGQIAADLLGEATTRIVYDLTGYWREPDPQKKRPAVAATLAREKHASEPLPAGGLQIQVSFSYSDGSGREVQKKIQAEPGPVPRRNAAGKIIVGADGLPEMTPDEVSPRWVGSGWTMFNNKGKPVRQYEPFFTDTHRFEFDVRIGVSPVIFYDPVDRVVATLHPNHTWEKVVFDPWRQETWDVNDTVLVADPAADADVGDLFNRLPEVEYLPTWYAQRQDGALGPQERAAARKAAVHAATPTVADADSLGRTFLTVAHNKFKHSNTAPDDAPVEEFYATRVVFDIEGNQREVIDALGRVVMRYDYDMLGNRVHQASMEAGERWMLNDVAGKPLYAWDSREHRFRTGYDTLRRPTDSFLCEGASDEVLVGRSVYGESLTNPEGSNARGKVVRVFDQAGVVVSEDYDFKGNALSSSRQLAQEYKVTLNWSGDVPLEANVYASEARYDALNRPIELTSPDNSVIRPGYNEASLLEQVEVNLRGVRQNGQPVWTPFVTNIDYDAKGQRTLIDYGNGVCTTYAYDPLTFRLVHLLTRRNAVAFPDDCPQPPPDGWPGCQVQNLHYTYDPSGNITHIHDDAQQTIYFRNKRVEPSADYTYDAVYRLIEATGREHLGQVGGAPVPSSYNDMPRVGILFSASDGNAMGRYLERYVYDSVGNFQEMIHRGSDPAHPGWTRAYVYDEPSLLEPGKHSNRLTSTTLGSTTEVYRAGGNGYDAHGNMLRMPHLQIMQWDFKDQLHMTQRQAVNADDEDVMQRQGERTWYVYDAGGQRVRKVTELASGQVKDERIYLSVFEIYRRHGVNSLVRETLHIIDGQQRIALVETRTEGSEPGVPPQLTRYQHGNHLGSACLELDDQAQIMSYEEYTPYGSSSYQAVRSQTETPKRYRYTGKERDEETGLYYHGARYYAPWLGRWTSADPAGLVDGSSLYEYVRGSPTRLSDPNGMESDDETALCSSDPEQNVSGGWIGGKSEAPSWLEQASQEENEKLILTGWRETVAAERIAQGRTPEVDFSSPEEVRQDLAAIIAYNNALWEANEPIRQYHAEMRYRQYEWNATGEGGAPPEGWSPPERPMFPGMGDHLGSFGREVILIAASSPRAAGVVFSAGEKRLEAEIVHSLSSFKRGAGAPSAEMFAILKSRPPPRAATFTPPPWAKMKPTPGIGGTYNPATRVLKYSPGDIANMGHEIGHAWTVPPLRASSWLYNRSVLFRGGSEFAAEFYMTGRLSHSVRWGAFYVDGIQFTAGKLPVASSFNGVRWIQFGLETTAVGAAGGLGAYGLWRAVD